MQQLVIALVALALVVPFGAIGLAQLFGDQGSSEEATATAATDTRAAVDPSSQPEPAPTTAPTPPAGLTEQTSDGAQATLRYLLESYAYMMATGDTQAWTQGVDPACQVCVTFIANAKQLHQQGGWGVGGEFTVTATSFEGTGEPPVSGTATADFTQGEQLIIDDPAKEPLTQPSVTAQIQARMAWDGERWRVGDMSILEQGQATSDAGGAQG